MASEYDVTAVGVSPTADRAHRMRVYFAAMTVRVACVASLFFVRGWWVLLVGIAAIVLPYFAVLVANQVEHRVGPAPDDPTLELPSNAALEGVAERVPDTIVIDAPAPRRHGEAA